MQQQGIYSSVNDLSKWAIMQMNNGKYGPENKQLFSEKEHDEMWHYKLLSQPRPERHTILTQRLRFRLVCKRCKRFKQVHIRAV
jgi:hypothetical protein